MAQTPAEPQPAQLEAEEAPSQTDEPDLPTALADKRLLAADRDDIVDEWGKQSFPASDAPSNW